MKTLLLFAFPFLLCTHTVAQVFSLDFENTDRSIMKNDDFILIQDYDMVWDYSESVWEHTRNTSYSYNDFNNPIEKFESWTDGRGPYKKSSLFYDANQNLDEERVYKYNESEWLNDSKTLYNYDGNNNRIQKTRQVWNGEEYENESKSTYAYDANNHKIYQMMYYWDEDAWEESQQFDFQYDENDNLYQILSKVLEEDVWIKHQKIIFTYDTTNLLLYIESSSWDADISGWAHPDYKQLYTYDQDNNRIIFIMQSWNEYNEVWDNQYKTTYYYLPVDNENTEYVNTDINKTIEDLQATEDDIIIDRRRDEKVLAGVEVLLDSILHTSVGDLEFTLSHNGISVTIVSNAGGDGDNFIRTKLSDRGVDSLAQGLAPFYGIYKPENPLSAFLETDPAGTWTLSIYDGVEGNTGTLQTWGLNLIYASSSGIDEGDSHHTDLLIYPNPAGNEFNVQSLMFKVSRATLEIFNLNGRKFLEKQISNGTKEFTVDVSQLNSGLYFCRINTDKYSATKKLMIK